VFGFLTQRLPPSYFSRWVRVGILTKTLGAAIFTAVYHFENNVLLANVCTVLTTPIFNYLLHQHYTFKHRVVNKGSRFKFYVAFLLGFILDTCVVKILITLTGAVFLSKFLSEAMFSVCSYFVLDKIVFKEK